jgi:VIT1/CCC1 family predicted Fe2+/Mn2+ transporter
MTFDFLKKGAEAISKAPDIKADEKAKKAVQKKTLAVIKAILNSVKIALEVVSVLWKGASELVPEKGKERIGFATKVPVGVAKWTGAVLGTILTVIFSSNILTLAVVAAIALIIIAWLSRRA